MALQLRHTAALALALGACSSCSSYTASPSDAGPTVNAPKPVELIASFDLPRETATQALSGTYYDEGTGTLYALKDATPSIIPITPSSDYRAWSVGAPIALTGRPDPTWDGEGLARGDGGTWFAVTVETAPLVERFSAAGAYLGPVATPARFAMQAAGNQGIESLSRSPSGKYLFFANEGALTPDGPVASKAGGTRIRILRRDLATGQDEEHAYLTEPTGDGALGTLGVSDVTAIGDSTVLVLERGFQSGYGNTVRIYVVELSSGPDVSMIDALVATTPTVTKRLVVDLASLPADGITNPSVQPNPLLDNYEGLALGPLLPDGRRLVFVTSDDNERASEVARILVLALQL